jgi:hypothetical protein
LKDFMDEKAKINKDTVTKFKTIDKVLENIDSKVTEVGSSNHQVLNMMKMLETQVGQLAGSLTTNEGKLPGQPKGPESATAIQTRSGKETEDPERSAGARKPKPSAEAEEFAKEEVTGIVTEEPDFEMPGEDMKIPQLKPRYFRGKLDNHFEKFVEVVRRLSVGDSPRSPLNNRGKPSSSRKNAKHKLIHEPKRTHNTITTLVAPVARQSG